MATQPWRNSAYDVAPNFAGTVKRDKQMVAQRFKGNLVGPPGIPERQGHGLFMEETQERAYALNYSLLRECGFQGAHSNLDTKPIRRMSADGVFAARPDRGTTYQLGWQLQPAYPFHPLGKMARHTKPMENLGNIDPQQKPLTIDSYHSPHPPNSTKLQGCSTK